MKHLLFIIFSMQIVAVTAFAEKVLVNSAQTLTRSQRLTGLTSFVLDNSLGNIEAFAIEGDSMTLEAKYIGEGDAHVIFEEIGTGHLRINVEYKDGATGGNYSGINMVSNGSGSISIINGVMTVSGGSVIINGKVVSSGQSNYGSSGESGVIHLKLGIPSKMLNSFVATSMSGDIVMRESFTSVFSSVGIKLESVSGSIRYSGGYTNGQLNASTVSGLISVEGGFGLTSINTTSGDVKINQRKGEISVDTVSGDVQATGLKGNLSIRTTSGDLDVKAQAAENIRVSSVSGDIKLSDSSGALKVETTNGQVTVNSQNAPDIKITSLSGDVETADSSGNLEISTMNGDIDVLKHKSDEVKIKSSSGDVLVNGQKSGSVAVETLNGDIEFKNLNPEVTTNAKSSSGDIEGSQNSARGGNCSTSF